MYVTKIRGVRYEVTDGVYNPPLPDDLKEKFGDNIKEICETGVCPGLRTDTQWHAGRGTLANQFEDDPEWTKYLVQESIKQGYTPGANHVYIGQMADRTGDPNAWFAPGEGRSELIKRAKKKGKGIEAPGISVQAKPYEEKKGKLLNPKIVKRLEAEYKQDGRAGSMSGQELRQHIINTHGTSLD